LFQINAGAGSNFPAFLRFFGCCAFSPSPLSFQRLNPEIYGLGIYLNLIVKHLEQDGDQITHLVQEMPAAAAWVGPEHRSEHCL